jgi:uncharacterized protein with von Willebrand factor type A (vWA) domain
VLALDVCGVAGNLYPMFLQFFTSLRDAQVPVTLREYLTLMEALDADLADQTVENFYYLSRAALVKDERNLDKFDRVFGSVFKGLESLLDAMDKAEIPEEWLKKLAENTSPRKRRSRSRQWAGTSSWRRFASGLRNRRAATRAAASGSVPPVPRRSAPMATIRKAFGSGRRRTATTAP